MRCVQAHSPPVDAVVGGIKQEPQECEVSVGGAHNEQPPLKKIKQEVSQYLDLPLYLLLHVMSYNNLQRI